MKQLDEEIECKKKRKLEFLILNVLRSHGREINPDLKDKSMQIYDYNELSLYTQEEIAEASRRMYEKGWIYIFDDGVPYWHELKDKGRIALREHLEKNSEEDKMQQPSTRKPTYIKEQKNYNCQQFFGNISGCTFTMPSADSARPKSEKRAAAKKLQTIKSMAPMTLKYYRHGNNGILKRQRHRVYILYKKWTEWKWIDPNTSPDDFDAFFEGEPRHCNITWIANTTTLTILLKTLLEQRYIEKQTKCSATSLVKAQFGKTPNFDRTRLDKEAEERIGISRLILDTDNPLPKPKGLNADQEDVSDAALYEIYQGALRSTKGI